MSRIKAWGATLALGLAWLAGVAEAAEVRTLIHDGIERRFVVERPEGDRQGAGEGNRPAPALVALHGSGGDGENTRQLTGFGLAERGWVEIYPDGLGTLWNDGRRALSGGLLNETDDLGMLRAMVDTLSAEGIIDRERIYFAGISNGGAMVQRLVCQAPDLVAGAAVVIMNFPIGVDCPPTRPMPMLFILGTDDPLIPFQGGPIDVGGADRGGVMPAQDTLAFFAGRNGCGRAAETRLPDRDPQDGTRAIRIDYQGCEAALGAFILEGAGHTWPGSPERWIVRQLLGVTSQEISATAEIEAFFSGLAAQ